MAGQSASLVIGANPIQSITCVKGVGDGWRYQRVTRPTAGVLMALVSHVNPALAFCTSCAASKSVLALAFSSRLCSMVALLKLTRPAALSSTKHCSGVLMS